MKLKKQIEKQEKKSSDFENEYLDIIKYFYETCHANVETKDNDGKTPINCASEKGHLEVVKYLYETCHANVETKGNDGNTPINNASEKGCLEVVKYLYETCHAELTHKTKEFKEYLHSKDHSSI